MSPNNKAYVAITVHFVQNGLPICLLLDIIKDPHSHSGVNLAKAFTQVLEEFGISDKVRLSSIVFTDSSVVKKILTWFIRSSVSV